jgi:cell division protein FtsI/penicillin-binding protein 2
MTSEQKDIIRQKSARTKSEKSEEQKKISAERRSRGAKRGWIEMDSNKKLIVVERRKQNLLHNNDKITNEERKAIHKRKGPKISQRYHNLTDEQKENRRHINSKSHETRRYFTPYGTFTNINPASKACGCSTTTIFNRCVICVDIPIESRKYWRFGWKGKTWRELGWYSEPI